MINILKFIEDLENITLCNSDCNTQKSSSRHTKKFIDNRKIWFYTIR